VPQTASSRSQAGKDRRRPLVEQQARPWHREATGLADIRMKRLLIKSM